MKKIIVALLSAIVLSGCGVGTYSVSSGKADTAALSFTSTDKLPIVVLVDGKEYNIETVKTKAYRKDRNIKKTALNTIYLQSGQHDVTVSVSGSEVFSKKLYLSAAEHRIVEL
ncbi:MAG: lipoprotein [Candidatus Cryptobacteroides sp.]